MSATTRMARIPEAVRADLMARYAEPQRHYHVWAHVEALLHWFDDRQADLNDPDAVFLAILFHDAIYDPTRADNEALSAALLMATPLPDFRPPSIDQARHMITATAGHRLPDSLSRQKEQDFSLFLDMDLSILGSTPQVFAAYDAAIAHEYAHVPSALYRTGRSAILRSFLERPRLYFSDWGHGLFETIARANLATTIRRLDAGD